MELRTGSRWKSAVCDTEVIVVRAPRQAVVLGCGGEPLVPHDDDAPRREPRADLCNGTELGKRYGSDETGLELLCTKSGAGTLTADGTPIPMKGAKPLPASD